MKKPAAKTWKRPAGCKGLKRPAKADVFANHASIVCPADCRREDIKEKIREWAAQVAQQWLQVNLSQRDTRSGAFRYLHSVWFSWHWRVRRGHQGPLANVTC